MVAYDDGNTILKDLTFDQPTAWLATAVRRDPDLWNRQWVIEQLAQRTADTAAAAALAWAATRSDYFLTRAAACEVWVTSPLPLPRRRSSRRCKTRRRRCVAPPSRRWASCPVRVRA